MKINLTTQRAQNIQKLKQADLDLLIVGGGIVGAGIARDAALRGLRTGLIDQHDFSFGTSSRSSRLLHGGLRYLAQGRVWLVHEASVEKKVVHAIAPHVADPLPFVFPTYKGTPYPLWQMQIGVKVYDVLCHGRNLGKSTWLSKQEALAKVPGLTDQKLTGAVRYYDGLTNDARLTLDTIRSAVKAGAIVENYLKFVSPETNGNGWNCNLSDQLTGETHQVHARAIVNATGPWAQGLGHSAVKLRPTKGIHLVIERSRMPVNDAIVMSEGKRILFVIPWGERVILGTTDTDYNGPLDQVLSDENDITYVLRITNLFFPQAKITRQHVISHWAGLRPLIADPNGNPSDISRSHEIFNPKPGWWDVAGGKLTTYRLMSQQAVDKVVKYLGKPVQPCRTAKEPLLPTQDTQGLSGIVPPPFNRSVLEHFCAHEWAVHLDDVMLRRSSWHYYHPQKDNQAAQAADWMAETLGWTPQQKAEEIARYKKATGL